MAGVITGVVFPAIAGVVVFQITQGRNVEALVYWPNSSVSFSGETVELTAKSIVVANRGNAASKDVIVAILFNNNVKVKDSKIEFSSGKAATYTSLTIPSKEKGNRITIPILAPNETVTFTYLVEGRLDKQPDINIKSANSVGKYDVQALTNKDDNPLSTISLISLVVSGLACLIGIYISWKALAKRESYGNPNNTAFLFLHQELYTEAQKILEELLARKGPGLYELSNLAVCVAMMGKQDEAEKYIDAAKYLAKVAGNPSHREEGFLLFCEALVVVSQNTSLALEYLRKAVAKSKTIKDYISYSLLIKRLCSSSPAIDAVFKQL